MTGPSPEPSLQWCPIPHNPARSLDHQPGSGRRQQLARQLLHGTQDEFLGATPTRCKPGAFDTFCELALLSENLDDLFVRGIRFFSLISDHIELQYRMTRDTREFVIHLTEARGPHVALFIETWLSAWYRLARWAVGRHIPLEAVSFRHGAATDAHELLELFGSPPRFGVAGNSFRFSSDHARLAPVQDFSALKECLAGDAIALLDIPEPKTAYADQVVQAIRHLSHSQSGAMPGFSMVARHVCMTPQTLRRKLSEEGTHFKRIKDDIRRAFVKEQLRHSQRSVEEIAALAGFSEASSLIRAFKRWTGVTPAAFRRAP